MTFKGLVPFQRAGIPDSSKSTRQRILALVSCRDESMLNQFTRSGGISLEMGSGDDSLELYRGALVVRRLLRMKRTGFKISKRVSNRLWQPPELRFEAF